MSGLDFKFAFKGAKLESGNYQGEVLNISDDTITFILYNLGFGTTQSSNLDFHYKKLKNMIVLFSGLPEYAIEWIPDENLIAIAKRFIGKPANLEFYHHEAGTQLDLHKFHMAMK